MGPTPCYSKGQVVKPVAPFFFLAKVPFLNTERGVAM